MHFNFRHHRFNIAISAVSSFWHSHLHVARPWGQKPVLELQWYTFLMAAKDQIWCQNPDGCYWITPALSHLEHDSDGVAPAICVLIGQFRIVYTQIRCRVAQFSAKIQSVCGFSRWTANPWFGAADLSGSPTDNRGAAPANRDPFDHFRLGCTQIRPRTAHVLAKIH